MDWSMSGKIVRIGGASGFWGDSSVAAPQLVRAGVDYLVFDYLAELTMSILAAQRAADETAGWARDFVTVAMRETLKDIAAKNIRVLSNAGGLNPRGCAAALAKLAESLGVSVKIAVVEGDDVSAWMGQNRATLRDLSSGAPAPDAFVSANAYLGAAPVAAALAAGAQIVITGRCADSALALGALVHEFGWGPQDYDRLAAGSLVGHILECGAQGSGGLHTDWESVPRWEEIGYPIALCEENGAFTVTKPEGTGGLVTPAVVGEQMLYEIGDPGAYLLPDVTCDFRSVAMRQVGDNAVHVSGAKGRAPSGMLKVSATHQDGFKATGQLTIIGFDAARKAERTADAILARTRALFRARNLGDYSATRLEVLGAEAAYGPHATARAAREVVMHLAVRHPDKKALEIFAREIAPAGTSWSPGTTGAGGGRPSVSPLVRLFSCLIPRDAAPARVMIDGAAQDVSPWPLSPEAQPSPIDPVRAQMAQGPYVGVPLIALAFARSGDKGDSANIGVIARKADYLPHLRAVLTPEAVKAYLAHLVEGEVSRFDLPGIGGMNFLLTRALGGGGMASLRNDPLGKGLAQILLSMEVDAPQVWGLSP
jgi:hypothetical protein